jgi:hypothetical protein
MVHDLLFYTLLLLGIPGLCAILNRVRRQRHAATSFIEHLNLTIRQHVAAIKRRVMTLCQHEAAVRQQPVLYHNFCLLDASLQVPVPQPEPTHGSGSVTAWRPCSQPWQRG